MLAEARRQLTQWIPDKGIFQPCFRRSCKISDRIWAYNPWERNVHLCGQTIGPNKAKEVKDCNASPRVYAKDQPSLVQVDLYDDEEEELPYLSFPNCSVPCRFVDVGGPPTELVGKGTNWKIVQWNCLFITH